MWNMLKTTQEVNGRLRKAMWMGGYFMENTNFEPGKKRNVNVFGYG